jgi:alkanesulfonate monooxygenase SsuD/methylene tetrahydromethanopterin reductase-like flavin-dependent oxidoreductase (luciferase family)
VLAVARRAEEAGFDAVTRGEHYLIRFDGVSQGLPDSWSQLAALATTTERVALGMLVTCTNFRNPALLANMADTVDEISGGRLILGLGAGWLEHEFRAFGFPFDNRVSRFAEAVEVIHTLLHTGRVDFAGQYYQIRDCELDRHSPRPQGPPILIGTTGPRMLRLAARYADLWDTNFRPWGELPALQAALDAACAEVGRDPATLQRSASVAVALPGASHPLRAAFTGTPEELAERLLGYAAAGFSQVVVWLEPNTPAGIDAFAPILDLLDRG